MPDASCRARRWLPRQPGSPLDAWLEFIGRGHPHIPADGDWRVWRLTVRASFGEV